MIKLRDLIKEVIDDEIWYHGSPSGNLKGGTSGLHLGTLKAAQEALTARIGYPVEGDWDGMRKYGETLLCGKNTLKQRGIFPTGFNCDVPDEDFYPKDFKGQLPKYSDQTYVSLDDKPSIKKYRILCPMVNTPYRPYTDSSANARMKGLIRRGQYKRGIYYRNDGEDPGSISVVVPSGDCVKEVF